MSRKACDFVIATLGVMGLTACSGTREVSQEEYTSTPRESTHLDTSPGLAGPGGISLSLGGNKGSSKEDSSANGIGVNAFLWRGTLDTLSFMPLASADPLGGIVITDWWQSSTVPRERFKANAYIMTRSLRSDGVKVTIFRQVDQKGQWVDTPVNPVAVSEVENKILARARELRSSAVER